jgi:hypothetical protein
LDGLKEEWFVKTLESLLIGLYKLSWANKVVEDKKILL